MPESTIQSSGMAPFFLTGANAKIRVNNRTLAFCTDLSYSVKMNHVAPKILGMYEPHSVEPLSYEVSGSFTIVRYMRNATETNNSKKPKGVSILGNGVGSLGAQDVITGSIDSGNDGQAHLGMNPGKFANSIMFDIEVYQKTACGDLLAASRIRNCRFIQSDFKMTKRGAAIQTFQFIATYADEDSFIADFSGVGQNLGY